MGLITGRSRAVIAIENVHLFDEVQARTRELTESLEQQTATSEVLQVISSSPGDLEPVFQTRRLLRAWAEHSLQDDAEARRHLPCGLFGLVRLLRRDQLRQPVDHRDRRALRRCRCRPLDPQPSCASRPAFGFFILSNPAIGRCNRRTPCACFVASGRGPRRRVMAPTCNRPLG